MLALCLAILFITCQENTKTPAPATSAAISAVPLPNIVPGFKFPEDSTTILNNWLGGFTAQYFDTVSIYKHAWGIWAGLTAPSGEHYKDQKLLVYETWPGITDIQTMVSEGKTIDCPTRQGAPKLHVARQDAHSQALLGDSGPVDTDPGFWVTVAYDPTAACFATKNSLLDSATLASKITNGKISNIPAFPNTSIVIKPTFFVGKQTDNLIVIPAWPGVPTTPPGAEQQYKPSQWNSQVYVDVKNGQPSGKIAVPAPSLNPTPAQIAAATCNLSDFINFKVDSAAAAYINQQQSSEDGPGFAKAGDLALLVCMHVATKEISNWTWQTFFWTPDPANPPSPSDKVAASLRPKELVGAASHYAVSTAYAMVRPNQPIYNGTNTNVSAVIGYNPYLEAGLSGQPFNGPPPGFPNNLNPNLKWGMLTNCMSCHALAAYPGNTSYTGDQYISMNDPIFLGTVQVDFLWSIPNNVISRAGAKPATKK